MGLFLCPEQGAEKKQTSVMPNAVFMDWNKVKTLMNLLRRSLVAFCIILIPTESRRGKPWAA